YEEILATFKEEPRDPKLALAALLRIANRLTEPEANEFFLPISPAKRQEILSEFSRTPEPAESFQVNRQQILDEISRTLVQTAAEPEKRQLILDEISRTLSQSAGSRSSSPLAETLAEEVVRTAEAAFGRLTLEEQRQCRRVLARLVRVVRPE